MRCISHALVERRKRKPRKMRKRRMMNRWKGRKKRKRKKRKRRKRKRMAVLRPSSRDFKNDLRGLIFLFISPL